MNEEIISELEALIKKENPETLPTSRLQRALKGAFAPKDGHQAVVLRQDITYIVAVVVVQDEKVLMMRESKESCAGLWYLPTGRMDKNESIVETARREALEETGLEIEPESLILVESLYECTWMRFTVTGYVTGGTLKTLENKDKESMEANWYYPLEIRKLPVRCRDMFYLIDLGVKWFKRKSEKKPVYICLPALVSHSCIKVKVIFVQRPLLAALAGESPGSLQHSRILLCKKSDSAAASLPECVLKKKVIENFEQAVDAALKTCGILDGRFDVQGILAVEHTGKPHGKADGVCCTFIAEITTPLSEADKDLTWLVVKGSDLNDRLNKVLEPGMCITFESW